MRVILPTDGELIGTERDATDLIGQAWGLKLDYFAIPTVRMLPDFFDLSSGLAGAFIQKFVQYNLPLIFIGDLSAEMESSQALRDFVAECGASDKVRFVMDESDLPDEVI